jgi:uncharacterized SAM-binding protein YcdF (DUF218 family)
MQSSRFFMRIPDTQTRGDAQMRRAVLTHGLCALLLGFGAMRALAALRFDQFDSLLFAFGGAVFFAIIAIFGVLAKRRALLVVSHSIAILIVLAFALVGYTPLMKPLMQSLVISDTPTRSDAIVVLSCDVFADGRPVPESQRRLDKAYELLQQFSTNLVITRFGPPRVSYAPAVRDQLQKSRLQRVKIHEVGPIAITRDEAVQVAQMARERGWKRVLVVTDGFHTRRAKALFRGTGLNADAAPCSNPLEDFGGLQTPEQRFAAFRIWKYETAASWYSMFRGWL